ncbi:MAG TPA: hypothetical protein VMA71_03910 [Alloacidobacterium sp.]|nr:hypothetical protein [Alloacidobacterium sp.]
MAILYDLPRINERGDFGQKGPTCWYYASKLLLKFHEKLEKREDNQIYKQMKSLHGLRKALCEIEDKARRDNSASVSKELRASINYLKSKSSPYYYEHLPEGRLRDHYKKVFDHLNAPVAPYIAQLEQARKILDDIEGDGMDRLALLTNFVPDAGFVVIGSKISDVYADPDTLEKGLRDYGPMYTGGELTRATYQETKESVGLKQDKLIGVTGLKPKSAHICVIAGVKNSTVYYKDPNYTNEVFTADFDAFKSAINELPITLSCGAKSGACSHSQSKQIAVA